MGYSMVMPWRIKCLVGERLRVVKLALKAQQTIAQLSRVFGVSRPTIYKWIERFGEGGRRALRDGSRRPQRSPSQTTGCWVAAIRRWRRRHPHWGAKKIGAKLRQRHGRAGVPAVRTIAQWLKKLKLVRRGRRRLPKGPLVVMGPLSLPRGPSDVWTVDFKGWFRVGDGQRVEPLTVRDLFSRYGLSVRLLPDQSWWRVRAVFMELFRRYGLPKVIRMDNGGPFASTGPARLSRLSAWWTALGIGVEFTDPGHPEQNGAHEQFHRLLKAETTQPTSSTRRAQQRRIDRWLRTYNQERPHEALGQKAPSKFYRRSPRVYRGSLPERSYPMGWRTRRVRSNGQIRWQGRLRFIGEAFVGYRVGLKPRKGGEQGVYFGALGLGRLRASDAGGLRPSAYVRQRPTKPGKKKKL